MFIGIQKRDRCRICYSLILRDRSALFSSICCQKYYHLFKHIQRTKIPRKQTSLPYQIKLSNRTVCFRDLIYRYLHTEIQSKKSFSNIICYDCSKNLLDIEQCAKYLTQTINKLKRKFNKSNRLVVSSLSATFQKKEQIINHEQLPILNSDDDDEFDDLDGDDDDDDEIDDIKSNTKTSLLSNCDSLLDLQKLNRNNGECSGDDDDDDDDDEDDDGDDDEEGVIKQSQSTKQKHLSTSLTNISNLHDAIDPNNFQLRFAHMMANIAAASSPHQQHLDSFMNTYTNMQRNLLKISTDSGVTDQTTTTTTTDVQIKSNMSPILSQNKQIRSGRKRKSTPEKRVITNNNNNGDTSPTMKNESINNSSSDNFNNHPLELTIKDSQRSNHMIQNGNSSYQQIDEDHKETMTPNDSSLSLSPLLNRRSTSSSKRVRLSTIGQNEHINNLSMVNLSNSTTDLLSPNHQHQIIINDDNHQRQQQRKLEPRPCAECGKVLFNDKTHLLHCQTHAKNEKQCWICGKNDDDIKKHILNEHGNQKFTNTGFKCQHCDKVFADFSDLQTHTAEHSKKKPFECPICHKRFGQQGNLSCHLRIHSGVKPFTCTNCGKAFRHSNSLRRHARTVHSASRGLTSTPNSLLVSTTATSLSNNLKNESSNDVSSGFMMAYDEGSSSTGGIPSPSISNTQIDSD